MSEDAKFAGEVYQVYHQIYAAMGQSIPTEAPKPLARRAVVPPVKKPPATPAPVEPLPAATPSIDEFRLLLSFASMSPEGRHSLLVGHLAQQFKDLETQTLAALRERDPQAMQKLATRLVQLADRCKAIADIK